MLTTVQHQPVKKLNITYTMHGNHNETVYEDVLAGYTQAINGQVKDFHAVCDRLEAKYQNGIL